MSDKPDIKFLASTDRRPVDPPPIIQLKIFDEESETSGRKDITYSYRANFFMYADLEYARPQATNSRMARDVNNKPVLCGAPVSGISYLDRPDPAGYFIFPDLSVRNEGNYRLSFTLWEDLKDNSMEDPVDLSNLEPLTKEHITARCNVKSNPFVVFSAKKFPGLSESTAWSRTVAEQGCRVRIRRDIRMRKRDPKDSKAWASDDEDADPSQPQTRRASSLERKPTTSFQQDTPANPTSRRRSPSHISTTPAHPSMQRTSAPDMNAQYHQQGYSAQHMVVPSPQHSYPLHASHSAHAQQYDPYAYAQHQPQPVMQQQQQLPGFSAPPPPPPFGYGQAYFHSSYAQPYAYVPPPQMQSPTYLPPTSHLRHNSLGYVQSPQDYGPGAQQYPTPAPPQYGTYSHAPNGSMHTHQLIHPNGSSHAQALTASPAPSQDSQSHSVRGSGGVKSLPSLQTHQNGHQPSYDAGLNPHAPPFYPAQQPRPPYTPTHNSYVPPPAQYLAQLTSTAPTTSKRSYGTTFDTQHIDQRLQSGARPDTNGINYSTNTNPAVDDDSGSEDEPVIMEYRRADGTMMTRIYPGL